MRCRFCENLSISQLIELAEVEFKAHYFPQKAYHQHHASYNELLESANRGCDLCLLILEGFQETILDSLAMDWEGYTIAAALQDIESRGHATDLKLCINAGHLYDGQMLKDTKLLDTLMIQAGNILIPEDEDHDENWIPPLELMISAPRSSFQTSFPDLTSLTQRQQQQRSEITQSDDAKLILILAPIRTLTSHEPG